MLRDLPLAALALLVACTSTAVSPRAATHADASDGSTSIGPVAGAKALAGITQNAASAVTVSGVIRDVVSGQPVAGVAVTIAGKSASSGANGDFAMTVPAGATTVQASFAGYRTYQHATAVVAGMPSMRLWIVPLGPTAMINPEGGTIGHRGARVEFSKGAFAAPTQVQLTMMDARGARSTPNGSNGIDPDHKRAWIVMGALDVVAASEPAIPAHVLLPVPKGLRPERLALLIDKPEGGQALVRPKALRGRWIEFEVPHFSCEELVFEASNPDADEPPPQPLPQAPPPPDMSEPPSAYDQPNITSISNDPQKEDPRPVAGQILDGVTNTIAPCLEGAPTDAELPVGGLFRTGDTLAAGSHTVESSSGEEVEIEDGPATISLVSGLHTMYVAVKDGKTTAAQLGKSLAGVFASAAADALNPKNVAKDIWKTVNGMTDTVAEMLLYATKKSGVVDAAARAVVSYRKLRKDIQELTSLNHVYCAADACVDDRGTAFVYSAQVCAPAPDLASAAIHRQLVVTEGAAALLSGGNTTTLVSAGQQFDSCAGAGCDPTGAVCVASSAVDGGSTGVQDGGSLGDDGGSDSCGDGFCSQSESHANCPSDCKYDKCGPGADPGNTPIPEGDSCSDDLLILQHCSLGKLTPEFCGQKGQLCTDLGGGKLACAGTGTTDAGTTDTTAGDTVAGKKYTHVRIDGSPYTEPDCKATNSPGPDIDVVALWRGGKLQGVGRVGSAVFKKGAKPACEAENKHNEIKDAEGPLNTKMYADNTPDTGYVCISNGTVVMQIGACTAATDDIKACDGKGAAVDILPGDELDVYEVDASYKAGGKGPQSGIAPDKCKCVGEDYQVYVGPSADNAQTSLGTFQGTKGAIKVN